MANIPPLPITTMDHSDLGIRTLAHLDVVDGEAVVVGKVLYESVVMSLGEEELRVEMRL